MCDIEKPLNFNKTYIFYIKNVAVVFHSAHSLSIRNNDMINGEMLFLCEMYEM